MPDNQCRMTEEEYAFGTGAAGGVQSARRMLFLALLAVLAILFGAVAHAQTVDAASQVWLLSTREAPHCGDPEPTLSSLRYWRLDDDCQWSPAEAETFHTNQDETLPIVVFIHGNRTDADEAVEKGWFVYECIRAETAGRPFRYVIWSWPAEQVSRRTGQDARLKADYSDVESYYLALWLDQLPRGVKVSLAGHSFGPRIVTGALHLLAGGQLAGQRLPPDAVAAWTGGKRNPIRAVLLAAAMDADWLAPGGCHGLALPLIDRLLVTHNGCDRVLRWYPRMYGRGGSQALGFVGPCGIDDAPNVELLDVSSTVGKIHDWRCYCSASNVCRRWAQYTFLEHAPAQDTP